jgi:hypothetical protein
MTKDLDVREDELLLDEQIELAKKDGPMGKILADSATPPSVELLQV